jgi:hypothetical protein
MAVDDVNNSLDLLERLIDRNSDLFLLDSYTGQGGFLWGYYLLRHSREGDDKFIMRKKLSVYPNFVRKIVDVYMGFLWKKAPVREVDDLYNTFMANADGAGTKLDTVLFAYQRLAMILGTVFVIVDKPKQQGPTAVDQAYPYLSLRLPGQLVRERKDPGGAWEEVTFSEVDDGETYYRTFSKTGWTLSSSERGDDIVEQGSYNLGRVPVVRLHIAKPLNPADSRGHSFVYDLAGLNWDLYNCRSELRQMFRDQVFSILTIPINDENEREKLKDMTISTDNAITYNPAGGGKPAFIAPSTDAVDMHMKHISQTVDDIYKMANLEFVGGVQQSGVALSFHFQEANSSMVGMAEMCEAAECEIAQLVYLWQWQEFTGNISYPKDFNLKDLTQALQIALQAVSLNMGAEFDKALKKLLARQILGDDTDSATMSDIDSEIESSGDIYGDRILQQAKGSDLGVQSDSEASGFLGLEV